MSTTVLARLRQLQRDRVDSRAFLFSYYRREMRWGSARAHHYAPLSAWHDPLTLVRQRGA
jgi:hypothetical protein